jgi:CelD/BcsL family acetyltransferase involved in cellulose biosynthesis
LTCTAAQTGFAEATGLWRRLLEGMDWSSVFLTPEWQEMWWEQFGGDGWELRLLTVGPSSSPLGIAPMALQGDTLAFLGDTDLFDYHDFVGSTPEFYKALVECLGEEPWRTLDLRSVPQLSPTLTHLVDLYRAKGYSVSVDEEDVVPGLALPKTWDEYLAGLRKKDRHELRRKLRRLEAAGDVRLVLSDGSALDEDVDTFLDLMRESREEKRDFMQPEREAFFRRIVRRLHELGHLRLFFLDIDGERTASVICFDHDGRRLLYNSGYRLAHRALSTGLMLKALCLKDAIEQGLHYFDFLRGPEPYKYHLGAQDVLLYHVLVRR